MPFWNTSETTDPNSEAQNTVSQFQKKQRSSALKKLIFRQKEARRQFENLIEFIILRDEENFLNINLLATRSIVLLARFFGRVFSVNYAF